VSGCVILLNGFAIFFLGKNGSAVCSVILLFFFCLGGFRLGYLCSVSKKNEGLYNTGLTNTIFTC
jgi:hypothetical protein